MPRRGPHLPEVHPLAALLPEALLRLEARRSLAARRSPAVLILEARRSLTARRLLQ